MSAVDLLPCPFCGGKAKWETGRYADGADWRYIACDSCDATGPGVPKKGWNKAAAIAAWNRRAPVSAGKVKALVWEPVLCTNERAHAVGLCYEVAQRTSSGEWFWWLQHLPHRKSAPFASSEAAKAAAQADFEIRILSALQPGDGWQDISSAKLDRSQMIVAVPDQHRTGWIVGEAYYDPEAQDWFWAGTGVHGVDCGPISEANHWLPELWQPMPEPSAPPASLPQGEETR